MALGRSLVALVCLGACNGGSSGGDDEAPIDADPGAFDRRALLEHLATSFAIPAATEFATAAHELADALDAGCDDAAKDAWRAAMARWERVDAVLVGPAQLDMKALRNRIYSWPLVATCGIDREVPVAYGDPDAYDVTAELLNVRSLAAIEYLLFDPSTEHTCAAPPTGWDAHGGELPAARCALAGLLAEDVAAAADLAVDGWDAYLATFIDAVDVREDVNLASDALFYVDKMVKDMKLGEAAGISVNACGAIGTPCVREVEHRFADHATPSIRVNVRALREAFTGTTEAGDGPGFEDYLVAVGAPDVAERMTAEIDATIAAADALPESFLTALTDQHEAIVTLHTACKAITDDLKSQFLTVLGLDIPDDVAGDND